MTKSSKSCLQTNLNRFYECTRNTNIKVVTDADDGGCEAIEVYSYRGKAYCRAAEAMSPARHVNVLCIRPSNANVANPHSP